MVLKSICTSESLGNLCKSTHFQPHPTLTESELSGTSPTDVHVFISPVDSDVLELKKHIRKPLLWSCTSHGLTPTHQHSSPFLLSAPTQPQGLALMLATFCSHCHPLPKELLEYINYPALEKCLRSP